MNSRFALQTFTVRKFLKSPAAIESGFARIKAAGINAVELAYVELKADTINAVDNACKSQDMVVGSSQITFDFLDRNRNWVLQFHQQLNCSLCSVSVLPFKVIRGKREHMLRFAEKLEALGHYYRERGLQLCFHHHDYEFRYYGEDLGLDLLLANTTPENVGLELDTYWIARGGRSPQDMIRDQGGRVKVVHLRDLRLHWKHFKLKPVDCELGRGNLDFKRIVDSCIDSGVHYMAIEQATDTPFESVAQSVKHLRQLGYDKQF